MNGIVIAGAGSGVGKTSITTGLLSMMSHKMKVQAYKIGPDFIDTMYHSVATGRPSRNLDTYFLTPDVLRNLVGYTSRDADICVVEGVRGLYEGISGTDDRCSTAEIAKILGFPVILVINCRSITRSAAAIINGFMSFDKDVKIAGVILNNVSGPQHEKKLRDAIGLYTDVRIIGIVYRCHENILEERHLGLKTVSDGKDVVDPLERLVSDVDIDAIVDIAGRDSVTLQSAFPYYERDTGSVVAIPMDDAYSFYYRENIECFEASGCKIRYFSPVAGDSLPDADVYYIGGGYPELFLDEISSNRDFLEGIKCAADNGKTILAECGGLMTMCSSMSSGGKTYAMGGIFDAKTSISGRHGPIYVDAQCTKDNPLFSGSIRGHEFHYSKVVPYGDPKYGFDIRRGVGIVDGKDGLIYRNVLGTYIHQHALSYEDWVGKMLSH